MEYEFLDIARFLLKQGLIKPNYTLIKPNYLLIKLNDALITLSSSLITPISSSIMPLSCIITLLSSSQLAKRFHQLNRLSTIREQGNMLAATNQPYI